MANLTPLSTILNRMNRRQTADQVEEQYKVRDLDEAIRNVRKQIQLPWTLKKTSLRVFQDVLEYPVESDHDEMAFFDNDSKTWNQKPKAKYTSIEQFYQDPDNTNDRAEIWNSGVRYIGLRYRTRNTINSVLNNAETLANWTTSGDAGTAVLDTVFFREGAASIRVPITLSTSSATIRNTVTTFSDSDYKRKYQFKWVYLPTAPTSISLRLETDSSNYLATTVTAQFSGQPFQAGAWNLIAQDLNAATQTGTFNSASIASEAIVLVGAATGTYYIDASYLRSWELLDNWYYSKYLVATVGNTSANQEYFFNSNEVYSTDSAIIGDSEWVDVIMYEALLITVGDKENEKVLAQIMAARDMAWSALFDMYPSLRPNITTTRYNYETIYPRLYGYDYDTRF